MRGVVLGVVGLAGGAGGSRPAAGSPGTSAWSQMVSENSKKLRGAALEIGDVHESLERVEQVESRVERDLRSLVSAFSSTNATTSGPTKTHVANLLGLGTGDEASLAFALGEHLSDMRRDLASLVRTINATRQELAEARDAVGSTERALEEARYAERRARVAERLRDGKATVDYETGEVSTLLSPSERRRIGTLLGAANLSRLEAHLLEESMGIRRDGPRRHDARRFDRERQRADPALLHLDTRFLQDMVVLSLSTAIGGLAAAALEAPHTLGTIVGGVVVGPSCLDLVRNLEQAETLAQFGSIFLLFAHGLMYSRYYGKREPDEPESADSAPAEPGGGVDEAGPAPDEAAAPVSDDAETPRPHLRRALASGVVLVLGLGIAFAFAARLVGVATRPAEAALYAAAYSLSSSSTVLATLRESRLDDSIFGRTLIELLGVQDLVLAPLLALPTAVSELAYAARLPVDLARVLASYGVLLLVVVFAARRVLPRALGALADAATSKSSPVGSDAKVSDDSDRGLFARRRQRPAMPPSRQVTHASLGLCVVGYALAMALLADRLKLSHEAGALFAGLVLVGTPRVDEARRAVEPLTSLFGGMYIASLGLVASPKYLRAHALPLLARVLGVLLVKLAVVAPLLYALGFSRVSALAAGVVFGQVSELALFVAARAHRLHLVERSTYLDVLSSTVILLALAPLAVHVVRRLDRKHFFSLENRDDSDRPTKRHTFPSLVKLLVKMPFSCATNLFFLAKRRAFLKPQQR
ncbi:hypothetical protein CTAYLR_001031 [Chrysophaeum taylorii]|uniref:Cation/H+ exchanger transmembrane domain-containing protein n=1 Tax=Chrysophaeum taylorii TaxID=2483200 RepID=A0AAD7UFL5_9STRA|nr:hypothetical protein CTAYLR_001031 [Chrysophaeum taylorii]